MKIGKLPEPVLIRSVLKQVKHRREEVLVGPAVGQDCAALEVGEDEVLVMSTDPITGTARIWDITASISRQMILRQPVQIRWE